MTTPNVSNVFVEKYRPKHFHDIVLDEMNRTMLENIISTKYFPNLLFCGPPGTGKTTTAINLIQYYQETIHNHFSSELIIHLNASDERGIDVVRFQISQFVQSKTFFHTGLKFVILDEVDHMTDNAQRTLRNLIQEHAKTANVRFCLICNYISRIDSGLQNEFVKIRFNNLPQQKILSYLQNIVQSENIQMNDATLLSICSLFKSDMRSMINYIQTNQNNSQYNILTDVVWTQLFSDLSKQLQLRKKPAEQFDWLKHQFSNICENYSVSVKHMFIHMLNYLCTNVPRYQHQPQPTCTAEKDNLGIIPMSSSFLTKMEKIIHVQECPDVYVISYVTSLLLTIATTFKSCTSISSSATQFDTATA